MTTVYVAGVAVAIIAIAIWWLRRDNRDLGRSEAERDAQDQALDDVAKANAARDRVLTDPDYRDSLRRFDRPE